MFRALGTSSLDMPLKSVPQMTAFVDCARAGRESTASAPPNRPCPNSSGRARLAAVAVLGMMHTNGARETLPGLRTGSPRRLSLKREPGTQPGRSR